MLCELLLYRLRCNGSFVFFKLIKEAMAQSGGEMNDADKQRVAAIRSELSKTREEGSVIIKRSMTTFSSAPWRH